MGFKSFYIDGKSVKSMSINGKLIFRKQEEEPYAIKIVAEEPNATVSIEKRYQSAKTRNMQYSYNGKTWTNFSTYRKKTFEFTNVGDYVYVRARLEGSPSNMKFSSSGKYSVYGNIASLVSSQPITVLKSDQTFLNIFKNSVGLVKAKLIIDFESVPKNAFYETFSGATSLVEGPDEINIRSFGGDDVCFYMFKKCSSLITPPKLPSVNLRFRCYGSMFSGCTSMTKAPVLPATTLAEYCYSSMFYNTSVEEADIMATKFPPDSASFMFQKCTSLKSVKVRLTEWTDPTSSSSNTNGSYRWLFDVSSTGTFYCPPELDISFRSANTIPPGWDVVRI